jgi:TM2 domain-containing membrane protein YozV
MVLAWIASPGEIVKGIKALIFVVDLLIILSILFLDIFYTNLVDSMFRFNQLIQPLSRKYLRHSSAAFIRS